MSPNVAWGDIPAWLQIAVIALATMQIAVEVYALVRLAKTPDERLVFGKKWPWVVIILLVNLIGAVVFLAAGRTPAPVEDPRAASGAGGAGETAPGERAARAVDALYGREGSDGQ